MRSACSGILVLLFLSVAGGASRLQSADIPLSNCTVPPYQLASRRTDERPSVPRQ